MTILQLNRNNVNGKPFTTQVQANETKEEVVDTSVSASTEQQTSLKEANQNLDSSNTNEVKMVIQGPLSHVYTRALQAMYALEEADIKGDGPSIDGATLVEDNNTKVGEVVGVYVVSDKDLESSNESTAGTGNRLKLALDSMGIPNPILAVECVGIMTDRKNNVLSYMRALGVEIVHSPLQAKIAVSNRF